MQAERHLSRLKNRPEFLQVARGRRFAMPGLVLQAKRRPQGSADDPVKIPLEETRVGFTATKKTGNAVVRNRIRRRLKAAANEVLASAGKPGFDYVLVGRAATFDRPWQSLLDDLGRALHMVHRPPAKSSRKGPARRAKNDTGKHND